MPSWNVVASSKTTSIVTILRQTCLWRPVLFFLRIMDCYAHKLIEFTQRKGYRQGFLEISAFKEISTPEISYFSYQFTFSLVMVQAKCSSEFWYSFACRVAHPRNFLEFLFSPSLFRKLSKPDLQLLVSMKFLFFNFHVSIKLMFITFTIPYLYSLFNFRLSCLNL